MLDTLMSGKVQTTTTTEELWFLIEWAEETICEKGEVLSREVYDSHALEHRRLGDFEGLSMESEGTFSSMGGNNLRIWINPTDGGIPKEVFRVSYNHIGAKDGVKVMITDQSDWIPKIEPYLTQWILRKKRVEAQAISDAQYMESQMLAAKSFIEQIGAINKISVCASQHDWQRELEEGQDEKWRDETIEVTFSGSLSQDKLYVNERHPDFWRWKELSPSQIPKLVFDEKPQRFILPEHARFVRFE